MKISIDYEPAPEFDIAVQKAHNLNTHLDNELISETLYLCNDSFVNSIYGLYEQ